MAKDDIPKDMQNNGTLQAYPGTEDSDEEDLDALSDSYDVQMGKSQCNIHSLALVLFIP